MAGREYACIKRLMARTTSAPSRLRDNVSYIYDSMEGLQKRFYQPTGRKGQKQTSRPSTSVEPSNRRPLNSNTPPTKEYQSRKSTHICYAAEVQMHWHLQGTRTRKSKKWVAGRGRHSKSTFARNWHATHTTCHGT
jgi:hypothetical protein